jgi:hypothetical protein
MRRGLIFALVLPATAAVGVAELLRDGYAAPVLFGAHQWLQALRRIPLTEPEIVA